VSLVCSEDPRPDSRPSAELLNRPASRGRRGKRAPTPAAARAGPEIPCVASRPYSAAGRRALRVCVLRPRAATIGAIPPRQFNPEHVVAGQTQAASGGGQSVQDEPTAPARPESAKDGLGLQAGHSDRGRRFRQRGRKSLATRIGGSAAMSRETPSRPPVVSRRLEFLTASVVGARGKIKEASATPSARRSFRPSAPRASIRISNRLPVPACCARTPRFCQSLRVNVHILRVPYPSSPEQ